MVDLKKYSGLLGDRDVYNIIKLSASLHPNSTKL